MLEVSNEIVYQRKAVRAALAKIPDIGETFLKSGLSDTEVDILIAAVCDNPLADPANSTVPLAAEQQIPKPMFFVGEDGLTVFRRPEEKIMPSGARYFSVGFTICESSSREIAPLIVQALNAMFMT